MKKILLALILLSSPAIPSNSWADDTAITIYSKAQPGAVDPNSYRPVPGQQPYFTGSAIPGYAVVRQTRDVELPATNSILKYRDVAAFIDPTTVQFKSLTDPTGTKVAEQNYQFDLVSQDKLLTKYIDQRIEVERVLGDKVEVISGILLSTQGGLTIKTDDGKIQSITNYSSVKFPDVPGGLITKPTLVWNILTQKPGNHKTEVSYQTDGITWWADYNLTFTEGKDANSGTVDFGSWVSIINQTGATYNDAKLKLMAGDVQRAQPAPPPVPRYAKAEMAMDGSAAQFAEKGFFEYHLYTLNRPATLPDNSTKQLELMPKAVNVPVEKTLVYEGTSYYYSGYVNQEKTYGQSGNKKVDVYLKLKNTKENGMGSPLPSGRIRVNQKDDDGSLEFIGEDVIDHTPRNEDVLIKLGQAFDVVGERTQTSFTIDTTKKVMEEEIEIKIRNQKKQKARITVRENLFRGTGWQIVSSSHKYEKKNANAIEFVVDVAPEKQETIKYKVKYSW
jgi:hypothetical protein